MADAGTGQDGKTPAGRKPLIKMNEGTVREQKCSGQCLLLYLHDVGHLGKCEV